MILLKNMIFVPKLCQIASFERSKGVLMLDVEDCIPMSQTCSIMCDGELRDKTALWGCQAKPDTEGDLLQAVLSPLMRSPVVLEQGTDLWACNRGHWQPLWHYKWWTGSGIPLGANLRTKRERARRGATVQVHLQYRDGAGYSHSYKGDGSGLGEDPAGAGQACEGLLVSSGSWEMWPVCICQYHIAESVLSPLFIIYKYDKNAVYVGGIFSSNPGSFSVKNYKTIPTDV